MGPPSCMDTHYAIYIYCTYIYIYIRQLYMSNLICQHLDGYNRVWVNCSDSIDLTIDVGSDFGHHPYMVFMLLNDYRSYQVEEYILTSFKLAQKTPKLRAAVTTCQPFIGISISSQAPWAIWNCAATQENGMSSKSWGMCRPRRPFKKYREGIKIWLVVWNMNFMTFHILGIIIPTDFHIFQRGWNHQPEIMGDSGVKHGNSQHFESLNDGDDVREKQTRMGCLHEGGRPKFRVCLKVVRDTQNCRICLGKVMNIKKWGCPIFRPNFWRIKSSLFEVMWAPDSSCLCDVS